jgi:hypothetical protein
MMNIVRSSWQDYIVRGCQFEQVSICVLDRAAVIARHILRYVAKLCILLDIPFWCNAFGSNTKIRTSSLARLISTFLSTALSSLV